MHWKVSVKSLAIEIAFSKLSVLDQVDFLFVYVESPFLNNFLTDEKTIKGTGVTGNLKSAASFFLGPEVALAASGEFAVDVFG